MQNAFQQRRQGVLSGLEANAGDKSRKGSVDVRALGVIQAVNTQPDMYTTSSCSGRISIFAEPTQETRLAGKKGGEWVYASHDPADEEEVLARLVDRCSSGAQLVFRFEPFLLHAECVDWAAATRLLTAARLAGFRESGANQGSSSNTRIMVGVRCALRLEVPVADAGEMLVTQEYVRYLVRLANTKFDINTARIKRLEELIIQSTQTSAPSHQPLPALTHADAQPRSTAHAPRAAGVVGSAEVVVDALRVPVRLRRSVKGVPQGLQAPVQNLRARQVQILKRLDAIQQVIGAASGLGSVPPSHTTTTSTDTSDTAKGAKAEPRSTHSTKATNQGNQATKDRLSRTAKVLQVSPAAAPASKVAVGQAGAASSQVEDGQLRWSAMPVEAAPGQAFDPVSLLRWGASSVTWRGKLVVVGGYGGVGTHARRSDVLICEPAASANLGQRPRFVWRVLEPAAGCNVPCPRMGHATALIGDHLVLLGGRSSPAHPLNDVWLLHLPTGTWSEITPAPLSPQSHSAPATGTATWPGTYRHSAVAVATVPGAETADTARGSCVYVFGGRTMEGVTSALCVLIPPSDLAGGYGGPSPGVTSGWHWCCIPPPSTDSAAASSWPAARKSHAAVALGGHMIVHGGTAMYGGHQSDMYRLDVAAVQRYIDGLMQPGSLASQVIPANIWQQVGAPANTPSTSSTSAAAADVAAPACFSHTLTPLGPHHVLLVGGHPTHLHQWLLLCDTRTGTWQRFPITAPDCQGPDCILDASWLPVRHSTSVMVTPSHSPITQPSSAWSTKACSLVVVGGGAFCFSFGSVFSGVFECDITRLFLEPGSPLCDVTPVDVVPVQPPACITAVPPANSVPALKPATTSTSNGNHAPDGSNRAEAVAGEWVLQLPAKTAKPVKDALKAVGWLDTKRKAGELHRLAASRAEQPQSADSSPAVLPAAQNPSQLMVVLPLTPHAVPYLMAVPAPTAPPVIPTTVPPVVVQALTAGASLIQLSTGLNPKFAPCPQTRMQQAVQALLPRNVPPETVQQLMSDLPVKWEKLGDLALIPEGAIRSAAWSRVLPGPGGLQPVYEAVAASIGVARLAQQAPVASTGTRDSQAVMLLGDDGWVEHHEHGVTFVLDVTRCMYSSGNVTERGRMGRLASQGETVVDMFTGIGYYTLPLLVVARVSKVIACEWNPAALECLARGLQANGVQDRCEVRAGDCRQVAPVGVADRVSLGLLPHSRLAWPAAVAALKPTGGWLHVHNNVLDADESSWVDGMVEELQQLCSAQPDRQGWSVQVKHVERVKWYAPRIRHIVVDVLLRPST